MIDYESRMAQFRTTIISIQSHSHESSKFRFIAPQKWKNLMIKSLNVVAEYIYADKDLVHDLRHVINHIPEDKFIQAILAFQPFKPRFRSAKLLDLQNNSSKMSSTATNSYIECQKPCTRLKKQKSIIQRGSIILSKKNSLKRQPKTCQTIKTVQIHQQESHLNEYLQVIIQQDTLRKQFERKYHPFKKIIDTFVFILENKYKNLIDQSPKLRLEKLQQLIGFDVLVLQKLLVKISQPYQTVFQSQNPEEVKSFKNKIINMMKNYTRQHEKINSGIRKLMRHYSKKSRNVVQLQHNIPDFAQIANFNIPLDFQIDGCYIQAMNSLMQFAQTQSAQQTLTKLKQFRSAIARDVDFYYESTGLLKQRQICVDVQIQIVRFVLCKLKGWIPEIYAQLKYMQVVYGDEDIAYKYDDASYIYAQLITVFDSLEIQYSEDQSQYRISTISQENQAKIR